MLADGYDALVEDGELIIKATDVDGIQITGTAGL